MFDNITLPVQGSNKLLQKKKMVMNQHEIYYLFYLFKMDLKIFANPNSNHSIVCALFV
jgi:hypothetical protein